MIILNLQLKIRGEVFTPMTLVNEMLNRLLKEVWTNKNLKFDVIIGNPPYQEKTSSKTYYSIKFIKDIKLKEKKFK